jgi:transposase-like protein
MSTKSQPTSLIEAIRYFSDLDVATEYVAKLRWPNGPFCPACGCTEYSYLTTRRVWKCKACKKQYSVKVGTVFEESRLGLDKWLPAVWLIANSKNGISSHELGRALGVTQKSAWFMLHRIRLAMKTGSFLKLSGEVEVDETYIGGKSRNMHASERKRKGIVAGRHAGNKTTVLGMRQRDGEVVATVIPDTSSRAIQPEVHHTIRRGSVLYSDAWHAYKGLDEDFAHKVVDHAERYVDGQVHTNGIENFWSLVKRGLHGTYISVEPFHLFRYLDERVFTYNLRDRTDAERFSAVLGAVTGLRLTYAEVTGQD